MADKIQLRRDTQANWEAVNPILDQGELGLITDLNKGKLGDGIHGFNDLPWIKQGPDTVIHVEDFGAIGDGVTDDTEAFQAISDYVNSKGSCTIEFGHNKVYRLGRQVFSGAADGRAFEEQIMMLFDGINGLIINGNGSILKLNDGLHYGSFDPVTGEIYNPTMPFTDYNYAAIVGSVFSITNSRNIIINNLSIDGNNENLIVGGNWGDKGIQLDATGFRIQYSENILLYNCKSNYNGLDGIGIRNNTDQYNIFVVNSEFSFNGRQGCTIGGGTNFKFINTTFSNTGRGAISSAPTAGVDIEPTSGRTAKKISFENCLFENNYSYGIIGYNNAAEDIFIDNSEFWQIENGYPIHFLNKGVRIKNSKIHGNVATLAEDTIVENCIIDDAIHPIYGRSALSRPYIIENGNGTYINCKIERTNPDITQHFIATTASTSTIFNSCHFSYKGDYTNHGYISSFYNTTFYNCIFSDDVVDKTKIFSYYMGSNVHYFGVKNLGPNVKFFNWSWGVIGDIPSNIANHFSSIFIGSNTSALEIEVKVSYDPPTTTEGFPNGSIWLLKAPSSNGIFGWVLVDTTWVPIGKLNSSVWETGVTTSRPSAPEIGQRFFDTTLGKPIWFNGTNWIDATGTIV
jgi:hypothetical protein